MGKQSEGGYQSQISSKNPSVTQSIDNMKKVLN
jgi:hypothetical protein